jgi:glycosidase
MPHHRALAVLGITLALGLVNASPAKAEVESPEYASVHDRAREQVFIDREADWRNGPIIYQVIVDRFAPPDDLEERARFYEAPRRLRAWDEEPTPAPYDDTIQVTRHEVDFWGGNLQSLASRVDYLRDLGIDVLYLNPIHDAFTNHKYDARDYFEVSPEYGTRADVIALADTLHADGMRLVLDGVFNHMGRNSPHFQEALANPDSPWRDWYYIGEQYVHGYRAWVDIANLPEVNLENPAVRARIWGDPDSVVQGWLRDGVDGWRLDVAFDIGFVWLSELTQAAHSAKSDSVIIAEVWNYPEQWMPAVDGVMNMTLRQMMLDFIDGRIDPPLFGRQVERMVSDTGIEPLLKSWVILDNHDTSRIASMVPDEPKRRLLQALFFTLPGSPCIYYGAELGMEGVGDPGSRGTMKWDLATDENEEFNWMRQLIALRQGHRALRIGDFRLLDTSRVLAFMRHTDRIADSVYVIANPTDRTLSEVMVVRDSKLMSYTVLRDELSDAEFRVVAGTLAIEIPPQTIFILTPDVDQQTENYTPYKRVR